MPQRIVINSSVEAKPTDVGGCFSSAVVQGLCSERDAVWFDCRAYERAESHHYIRLQEQQNGTTSAASTSNSQRSQENSSKPPNSVTAPGSLRILPDSPSTHMLCDEGYLSQTPTPRTPASAPINGLPFVPAFLQGVWFQKSLYDRAETTFYQNLHRLNKPHSSPDGEQTCIGHPSSPVAEKSKSDKTKEKKPGNDGIQKGSSALDHFLHADSERVWLDRNRYAEVETGFYEAMTTKSGCSLSSKYDRIHTLKLHLFMLLSGPRGKTCTLLSGVHSRILTMLSLFLPPFPVNHNNTSQSQVARSSCIRSAMECLAQERIWFDKPRYDEAERKFYERMNGPTLPPQDTGANSILQDIARARENIQKSLAGTAGGSSAEQGELLARMKELELENQRLQKMVQQLHSVVSNLESRVSVLEKRPAAPAAVVNGISSKTVCPPPQKTPPAPADGEDDDDDLDLFGSDDEVDEEAERLKEKRLQEYAAKKAKKPAIVAKSSILLDVKPWDDETDMAKLEECVRSVQADGLLWGASKLVPVGYGIKKLQINCVVEDDKVGTDLLEEEITKFEDYVQSVDVAAFNKI
ncbi:eukaryotic translation elongation factor 1 delta b (guanine nucleotide exchange protein) [Tachysurus vachellii]|uniref:eukaryotic translation elongation factor 1 delta b (guanine nucleotide exchange protein) n=1 Tax=Tachysurus vachellii TaxID=175792 RepID=UPI00296B0139|nr:eukaryotic translation elongation factor 1 delta b (guanine nucleotide exchange protein) [Tachysurus vachellii]